MSYSEQKPLLAKRLFWDVNFNTLDYQKNSSFIIERVFERGDIEDIRQIRRYYGDSKLSESLLNAKYLDLKTIYLASAVIDRPITDFRCYKLRQSNQGHLPY